MTRFRAVDEVMQDQDREGRRVGDEDAIRGNDSVRSDLVDLTLVLHRATAKAILVSDDGTRQRARWLPRRHVDYRFAGRLAEGERADGRLIDMEVIEAALPQWLARDRGLI